MFFAGRFPLPLSVKQQRDPGDHIGAELEFQSPAFQHGHHIDAVALHTGVHLFREPAGFIRIGALGALGAAEYARQKGMAKEN